MLLWTESEIQKACLEVDEYYRLGTCSQVHISVCLYTGANQPISCDTDASCWSQNNRVSKLIFSIFPVDVITSIC